MEKKLEYQKPLLRKVRLEVKTSVLATCNTSTIMQPRNVPAPTGNCQINNCYTNTNV